MKLSGHSAKGFSLIELMIVITILGIMIAMAQSSMTAYLANGRVRATAESIAGGIQLARQEAIRRNGRTLFQMVESGGASGWLVCAVDGVNTTCPTPTQPLGGRSSQEDSSVNARVGASTTMGATGAALAYGAGLPGSILFNALGRPVIAGGVTNLARIDVYDDKVVTADRLRMVVTVTAGGSPRLCEPQLPVTNPKACL
jgi:type IV fimbrial biogenesis protein FimT